MTDEKVISIDMLRINRTADKKCTCKVRNFTIDTQNREITCGCGKVVDPFEAMLDVAKHYEYINVQHQALNEQRLSWQKEKPHSVVFKGLEQHYRRGKMLPYCPKCNAMFDFKDLVFWGNAEFYRNRLEDGKEGRNDIQ